MNQWPTIFVSFKDVNALDYTTAFSMMKAVISDIYKEHYYLLDSTRVLDYDKKIIVRIIEKEASIEEFRNSMGLLSQMLHAHYGKKVILLLDEYDVPIVKASSNDYYKEMLDLIRAMMSSAIKDNTALRFAVITGCLRIGKESIFTGLNNMVSNTVMDNRLNEYFGFTRAEVAQLLKDTELSDHEAEMKEWYDGYRFGDMDIYCPWDVMNHVDALLSDPDTPPMGYWRNSSDNAIIRSFIEQTGSSITKKFETLLSGGIIMERIVEDLTYDYLHSSEENLWSILYLTGYLTGEKGLNGKRRLGSEKTPLKIPNLEVKQIYEDTIVKWFQEQVKAWDRKALFSAVWTGELETLTMEMTRLLRKTISYHDYKEDFYHAFLAGIFAGAGYIVESNREHGEGRSDVVVQDYEGDRIVVFEVKYSKELSKLEKDCAKAVRQIDERMYSEEFKDDYTQVICYGIAFYKKRCMIGRKE